MYLLKVDTHLEEYQVNNNYVGLTVKTIVRLMGLKIAQKETHFPHTHDNCYHKNTQ